MGDQTYLQKLKEVSTPGQLSCLVFTCMMIGFTPQLIESTYSYTRYRKLERPDFTTEELSDFYLVIPCCFLVRGLKMASNYFCYDFYTNILKHKYKGKDLISKVNKNCKSVFKVVWFSFTFLFGLTQVLWKCQFASPLMLGDGKSYTLVGNWPYTEMPPFLKFHYMLSLSYYVEDAFMICLQMPNFDFWEMVMHHVVTGQLIFASYMSGFWIFGILILVQMDFSDIFIALIRVVVDCTSNLTVAIVYVAIMFSWAYPRFVCFIKLIIYDFTLDTRLSIDGSHDSVIIINYLLFTLLGLNLYWYYKLFFMGLNFAKTGKPKDTQQITSKTEEHS